MDENLKLKIGLDSLHKVKLYKLEKNFGRSFAHYLVYFELLSCDSEEHEIEFCEILCSWCNELENRNQIENLCKCYLQALHYFPTSCEILNNFGAHLIRINQNEEAKTYLKLACNLNKDFLPAEKNLFTVKLNLVPRWHFRMLNDYKRNKAYYDAITTTIFREKMKVLDIGAGCGILSLFASNNTHIDNIYAIEQSKTFTFIAKSIFEEYESQIKLLNKNSTDLVSMDINGRADLLIMEIFDAALFGEHVLETVIHAWDNLLKKDARIIPGSASVYVTGIECTNILKRHKFVGKLNLLDCKNLCLTQFVNEPYEADNLQNLQVKKVTNTVKVITVDFHNLDQLKNIYYNKNLTHQFSLQSTECGEIDAFVIWFDLHLQNNNTITTDPQKDNVKCWEQAVVYLDHPYRLNIGEDIELSMSCIDDRLTIKILDEIGPCKYCFKVSPEIISFLNDEILVHELEKLSEAFDNIRILDLNSFPLVGFILAKKGSKCYCTVNSEIDEVFFKHVCLINNINVDNVVILKSDDLEHLLECNILVDVILINPVSENGTINEKNSINFELYQNCLKPNGLIYPQLVNIYAQVVESEYLDYYNKVDDANLLGYEIAKHMNEYSILEQWVIDLKFPRKNLSHPMLISNVFQKDESPQFIQCDIPIIFDGKANGILYWFELVYNQDIKFDTFKSTHYNCACSLFPNSEVVYQGSVLKINVKQHRGLLKICCNT